MRRGTERERERDRQKKRDRDRDRERGQISGSEKNCDVFVRGSFHVCVPLFIYFLVGIVAGGTGAVVGTPAEISLIRMTADGRFVINLDAKIAQDT